MISHAPPGYDCPFCLLVSDGRTELTDQSDVVYRGEKVLAFVAGAGWRRNLGHVLVVPREHVENIYDIPAELMAETYRQAQHIGLAMKSAYHCDGISMRQHNEPAGDQDVWHFHVHVLPRYRGDELYLRYEEDYRALTSAERRQFADRLRPVLAGTGVPR